MGSAMKKKKQSLLDLVLKVLPIARFVWSMIELFFEQRLK